MKNEAGFARSVARLAVPAAMQSMLQSSFSIVDQLMIGQLGEVSIAGVGYAGKFASIFTVLVTSIGAGAGILLAQYMGRGDRREVRRSFFLSLLPALALAALFTALSILCPRPLMGLYTRDSAACRAAAEYLAIVALTYLPLAGATMLSTLLRCAERPRLPLYAAIASALVNTGLNYVLIFGKLGFAPMGARGAAIATVLAQWVNFLLMLALLPRGLLAAEGSDGAPLPPFAWRQYLALLLPLFACELLWSLGENVYTAIYGHLGTEAGAAMTLINPVQGLVIGALCGLSQAAGVLVGKRLGVGNYETAYAAGKRLLLYGAAGAAVLSVLVVLSAPMYVEIYRVEEGVKLFTRQVLYAYAIVAPFKVLNMIVGGILRSGGRTKYVLLIDILGTWGFGVPLGLLAGFVWRLTIPYVYFLLSLEECVRFGVSLAVFRRRRWMHSLEGGTGR